MQQAAVRPRLDSLTGLRFFAAFAVFALHALSFGQHSWGVDVFTAGTTGVSFFFVVSGFVMSWTARSDDTSWAFYRRRFARIYPAYVVTWLLSVAMMVLDGRRPSLMDLLPLTLLQSWAPSEVVFWATNAVFWTLSCEAFFYLAFPVLHRCVRGWTVRSALIGIAVLVVVIEVAASVSVAVGGGPTAHWLVTVFPVTRLLEFVIGMLLGVMAVRGARRSPPMWLAVALTVGGFLAANHVPAGFRDVAVTIVPFTVLVWAAAQGDIHGRPSVLRRRLLVNLGAWSFAFYLVHTLVMRAGFETLDRLGWEKATLAGAPLFLATSGVLLAAIVAAWLLHTVVEVPLERRLRPRRADRGTSKASPADGAGAGQDAVAPGQETGPQAHREGPAA
ncbi:acyltransferase family protein [Geodermatophilus sp. CPCC 205506]|uniref:acyltransferase family protein n=1 Tax=Geodermatophilus sp. CPCC 205506 TaxID=2936596 RepID=UPI003EED45F7